MLLISLFCLEVHEYNLASNVPFFRLTFLEVISPSHDLGPSQEVQASRTDCWGIKTQTVLSSAGQMSISNNEEVDIMKMGSGSWELEILGLQIIKFTTVERTEMSSSNLLNILTMACCSY